MRAMFASILHDLMQTNKRIVLLLAGVGGFAMRRIFADFPERAYNLGICEQAIIGTAAGLAKEGFIPIVYGIAPFLVERCYEQIKVDIGYNASKILLVTVGGSYDYSHEGPTHHCPADVAILYQVPGLNILTPGTSSEMAWLLREAIETETLPCYLRLSERINKHNYPARIGNAVLVHHKFKQGRRVVIAVGPALKNTLEAIEHDATVVYLTSVRPLDREVLKAQIKSASHALLVEPYYPLLANEIIGLLGGAKFKSIGVLREFAEYGTREELDERFGLDAAGIRAAFEELCSE